MLDAQPAELASKAQDLANSVQGEVVESCARVGGGALPLLELRGPAVTLADGDAEALAEALRTGEPPLIARIDDGRVLLDVRTLATGEIEAAAEAITAARERLSTR